MIKSVIINSRQPHLLLEAAVRLFPKFWPRGVAENAESGEKMEVCSPFQGVREVLIFRNQRVADDWNLITVDAEKEAGNTYLHLFAQDSQFTIVIDEPTPPEVLSFVSTLQNYRLPD